MTMKFGFGQALTRKEDDALLRGAGCYVADIAPAATLHAVMLRSPHAHARLQHPRTRPCARDAGRAAGAHRGRGGRPRAAADAGRDSRTRENQDPVYPILAKRRGAPCRRCHSLRGRRQALLRKRRRRGDRGRLAAAAACDRRHGRAGAGRAAVWPDRPDNLAFETEAGDARATGRPSRRPRGRSR